ncbi:MAG: class I SAM-dependent methyltransferase [Crocinitomicaceae bacterium]
MKTTFSLVALITALVLFLGCSDNSEQTEDKDGKSEHHERHGNKSDHDHGHSANEYMHQSSIEELIERFESPERDEYQQPERVLRYLGDLQGKTIMDVGAGSGYFSIRLAENGANVIAADVSDEFQEVIQKRIDESKIENIELRKLSYDSPKLSESEVDMVLIVNTYHHIEDRSNYFSKVKKGTKDDGELVVIDFFKMETPVGPPVDHKIAIDQVVSELKDAGFTSFDVNVDLLPYQYIVRAK